MPNKLQYKAGQLRDLLDDLQSKGASGLVDIDAFIDSEQKSRSRVVVLNNGEIVYGGVNMPSNQELARQIGVKCGSNWADTAVRYAAQKLQNRASYRELLEHIVRIRVFKWDEIEAYAHTRVAEALEQTFPFSGQLELDDTVDIDLSYGTDGHGLNWYGLLQSVNDRQQKWDALAPVVPSMEAVPQIVSSRWRTVTENSQQQHLLEKVDGRRSLIDIAEELDQDPLELAQYYKVWATSHLIVLREYTPQTQTLSPDVPVPIVEERPIVLSVDDSPVVQALIKRALVKDYQVLSANNALDALKLMNSNPIVLLLLDVTMPDIDGLEFCRTVRSIPKFKSLPIVMVTARDKFSDKLRGQIAGSTHYLTKPFEPESLLEIVDKYVSKKKPTIESQSNNYRFRNLEFQSQAISNNIFY
ncbi:hypothetical protein NUACC21_53780 [Scytonema sp. NUACC21]